MSDVQNSALAALTKFVEEEEKRLGIVRVPAPRDWVPCHWCGGSSAVMNGKGCISCFNARKNKRKELDEEYKRQFPDGPKPFFTASLDNPEEMEQAKRVIGREAIEAAFGPDGRGVEQIMEAAEKEMAKRAPKGEVS